MNNLVFALLIAVAGALCFAQREHEIIALRSATASNAERISPSREAAIRNREEARRIERLFVAEQEELTRRRAIVNGKASASKRNAPIDEPTSPEKEGFFPADRPYFYLSKARLAGLLYWPLNGKDEIEPMVADLFGMSGEEFMHAKAAYGELLDGIRALEKAVAVLTNTPPHVEDNARKTISVFVGKLPQEGLDALNQQFRASMAAAIGPERAQLLVQRIGETFSISSYGLDQERTITMIHDDEGVIMRVSSSSGNITTSRDSDEDRRHKVPPQYLHLFPQE